MTELLQKAMDALSSLPDNEQDGYAARLLEELEDERRWDESFAKSPGLLERLAAEALDEFHRGETKPMSVDRVIADD